MLQWYADRSWPADVINRCLLAFCLEKWGQSIFRCSSPDQSMSHWPTSPTRWTCIAACDSSDPTNPVFMSEFPDRLKLIAVQFVIQLQRNMCKIIFNHWRVVFVYNVGADWDTICRFNAAHISTNQTGRYSNRVSGVNVWYFVSGRSRARWDACLSSKQSDVITPVANKFTICYVLNARIHMLTVSMCYRTISGNLYRWWWWLSCIVIISN